MSSTRKKNQIKASTKHESAFERQNFSVRCDVVRVEDNEAVIKIIINGRSPTMRHVSRTHRVALDWLFDRINLDSGVQIRYVDTKHQLAEILTKGNFTRDEWNNLLHLFNISQFNSTCCAKNASLFSCITERMAKRMQEQPEENRIVVKFRPMAMNLTSSVDTSSSSVNSPIASRSPEILKASSRQVGLSGRPDANANQNSNPDAASSSPGWQMDAQLFIITGKLVATDKDQKSLNREEKSVISTGELVATEYQGCSENPEIPEDSEPKSRIWPHHFRTSPDCVPHMEKVFSIVRKNYDRKPTDDLKDLDVTTAMRTQQFGYIHVCHTSSCNSSWTRLFIKLTIRQESIFEVCGAIISHN